MTKNRGRLIFKAWLILMGAAFFVFASTTASFAQIDVGDAGDSVSNTADSATNDASDSVDKATNDAGDTADSATDTVNDTADAATGAVDEATGDNEAVGGTVDNATDKVDETVDQTTGKVDETVKKGKDTVDETTNQVNEQLGGNDDEGGRRSPLDDALKNVSKDVDSAIDGILGTVGGTIGGRSGRNNARDEVGTRDRAKESSSGQHARVLGNRSSQEAESQGAAGRSAAAQTAAASDGSDAGSTVEQILESAGRVATRIAFPLALLALVAAFLVIQGRFDRNDPKLALAPLDADQEYLSFR